MEQHNVGVAADGRHRYLVAAADVAARHSSDPVSSNAGAIESDPD
jgi:hypothetical protein